MAVAPLTVEQARQYLSSQGLSLPDFVLELLVGQSNSIDACLEGAGYDAATAGLIKLYLLSLLAVVQGGRLVTSQRAPSGAAQSFQFGTVTERYRGWLGLLRNLDLSNCTGALVPPEPGAKAALFVGTAGCGC